MIACVGWKYDLFEIVYWTRTRASLATALTHFHSNYTQRTCASLLALMMKLSAKKQPKLLKVQLAQRHFYSSITDCLFQTTLSIQNDVVRNISAKEFAFPCFRCVKKVIVFCVEQR